jgi:hypothetical protein
MIADDVTRYAWDQVQRNASKAAMLADSARMLSIRKNESDVIHSDQCTATLAPVPTTTTAKSAPLDPNYQPYIRYLAGKKAIIVCGNPNTASLSLQLAVPLSTAGFDPTAMFLVEDLWGGGGAKTVSGAGLAALAVIVPPDYTARGGLSVLKITPAKMHV